ncbi:hypothetical protein CC86DRAFT_392040 [Ophiobolus disseminans]|uniref:Nucleoporin NUP53 n=1 Tax=Ophiobolus disseminans TaxID=1469910 RepID=A0A6A7A9S1_9PLEO|nr:hypothetical protein CC86DRAFT_392040 [Ophiobolus disseminans]
MGLHSTPQPHDASRTKADMWSNSFDKNQRRMPEEKGPFGKARKRGTSRAKTPTANSALDEARQLNDKAIDKIFDQVKRDESSRRSIRGASGAVGALPPSASAPNLLDASGMGASFQAGASTNTGAKEPKEVILYGYGHDAQWAAIAHFESVSNGLIFEEYDREPWNAKAGMSFSGFNASRASSMRSLNKASLQKVNQYVGGDHWIKVTFDSAEAAERACHYSPHNIQGHTVFAEPYRGTGPTGGDKPLRANVGGALSQTTSPNTLSSGTLGGRDSSITASSATVTDSVPASTGNLTRSNTTPMFRTAGAFPQDNLPLAPIPQAQPPQTSSSTTTTTTTALNPRSARATLRLKGANVKPAIFLPQEKAFLPAQPRWQQTVGSLPMIGWVFGSGQGIIGEQIPRKEDGSFDAKAASLYWRAWYAADQCFGTDFCGVREAEYDD